MSSHHSSRRRARRRLPAVAAVAVALVALVGTMLAVSERPANAVTVPGAPTSASAVPGHQRAIVSWTAPASDGGSPITGYRVTAYIGFAPVSVTTFSSAATTQTVTALVDGTSYRFRVEALNALGAGPFSTASNLVTPGPTVPDPPTIGLAVGGNQEATVSWTAPANDGGSPITGYVVTPYVGVVAQTPQVFASTATTQTVTGLLNGTPYTFRVAAVNGLGAGLSSDPSNGVVPATVPDAPTIGVASAAPGEATVSWTAPASDGGAPIDGYVVIPYVSGVAQAPRLFGSALTTQVITGLANGVTYTFRVAAFNVVGTGPESADSNPVTPATVPDAPIIGTATRGHQEATVVWSPPPFDGGAPITAYIVTPYIGGVAQTPVVVGAVPTSVTITGLTNGTTYQFKVAAVNAVGTGPRSAISNPVTPAAVPGAPTIGMAVGGVGHASLSWTAPASDGGAAITGYVVTPYVAGVAQTPVVLIGPATTRLIPGLANGTVYTFRVAATNGIGTGPQSADSNPTSGVLDFAAGARHSCAVTTATTLTCWGANGSGQVGDGTTIDRSVPTGVVGLSGVTHVVAGESHTCALLVDSTVWCWGSNEHGQLGDGTTTSRATPGPVAGLSGVTMLTASKDHTCALLLDGTVRCWGYNSHGGLGDGTLQSRRTPVPVAGLTGAVSVVAGSWHSCALLSSGSARCWGLNNRGQLGDGTLTRRTTPVSVVGLAGASSLTSLGSSTCAVVAGEVRCWGLNHHGQLGDGTLENRRLPVSVVGLTGVADVSGGRYFACARLLTGTLRCWGYNSFGQLGNGTTTNRATPVMVVGVSGVVAVAAGGDHVLVRQLSGARAGWGANGAGQLGNGIPAQWSGPVAISVP